MDVTATLNTTVSRIAGLIEHDIRRRGLVEGSQYLTAEEVARSFSVHPRAASRAMKMLSLRGVLVRKRGVGTFVGPRAQGSESMELAPYHILAGFTIQRTALRIGGLVEGLTRAGLGDAIQLNFLPAENPAARARVILNSEQSQPPRGAVLVHCDREVQQAALESGIPAVVFGSVYADTAGLASVDLDQREIGRLFARYAKSRGAEQVAVFMREVWLPGDNRLIDGLHDAFDGNAAKLVLRSLPGDAAIVRKEMKQLFESPARPQAIFCRGEVYAQAAFAEAARLGLGVPRDLAIVVDCFDHETSNERTGAAHITSSLPYRELTTLVGKTLERVCRGEFLETRHIQVPVEF